MRVLFLHNDYLQAGGERQSVRNQIDAVATQGVQCEEVWVDNEALAEQSPAGRASSILRDAYAYDMVSQRIERFAPDLVHAENLFPTLGAGAIKAIRDARIPWVRTLRNYRKGCLAGTFSRGGNKCTLCSGKLLKHPGIRYSCYRGSTAASAGAAVYSLRDGMAERTWRPSAYLTVSRFVASELRPILPTGSTVQVVHNIVTSPPEHRDDYDVSFVGRLSAEKGVDVVLGLVDALPAVSFVVAGDGDLAPRVRGAARDRPNLAYVGPTSAKEARAVLASSKIALVPSRWDEPFGRVAAEAMAAGAIPLVAARGGLSEVVRELPAEISVMHTYEIDDWARRVTQILAMERGASEDLRGRCAASAQSLFSATAIADRLLTVYSELVRP